MTHETRLISITVQRPLAEVRAYLADPLNFAEWASGLAGGLGPISDESSQGSDPTLSSEIGASPPASPEAHSAKFNGSAR